MSEEQKVLRSLHLQIIGMQALLASLESQVRGVLGDIDPESPSTSKAPQKVASVSEEIRKAFSPPTAEESRENVFMRRGQAVDVPAAVPEVPSSSFSVASGTPNGRNPSAPSD